MEYQCLHDKQSIERRLRGNTYLHLYSIGDLDDFHWPHTLWFTDTSNHEDAPIVLVYLGSKLPVLLALAEQTQAMCTLLHAMLSILPVRFYAHLSPGLESAFEGACTLKHHGRYQKMALRNTSVIEQQIDTGGTCALGVQDAAELTEFYRRSYPESWFDPRMLETNRYYGLRDGGHLVSAAGVHVYSIDYQVAALGNISTLPSHRNRGYGSMVTARTCQSILREIKHIGLNVKSDNEAALASYSRLGFEHVSWYYEFFINQH